MGSRSRSAQTSNVNETITTTSDQRTLDDVSGDAIVGGNVSLSLANVGNGARTPGGNGVNAQGIGLGGDDNSINVAVQQTDLGAIDAARDIAQQSLDVGSDAFSRALASNNEAQRVAADVQTDSFERATALAADAAKTGSEELIDAATKIFIGLALVGGVVVVAVSTGGKK